MVQCFAAAEFKGMIAEFFSRGCNMHAIDNWTFRTTQVLPKILLANEPHLWTLLGGSHVMSHFLVVLLCSAVGTFGQGWH